MGFEIGKHTDVGRRRTGNEDSLTVLQVGQTTLCVVADGMGGHQAGEVASLLAVETIDQALRELEDVDLDSLEAAITSANEAILSESEQDPSKQGMGTTVVCALLREGVVELANVGDSPGFLVRGGQARQVTHDHSYVAEELARGAISPEDATHHPYRHILTRCLGVSSDLEVERYEPLRLQNGDLLLLCSDGLTEHVEPDDLPALTANHSPQEAAEALVALANERGGSDNITVIVARWDDPDATFELKID